MLQEWKTAEMSFESEMGRRTQRNSEYRVAGGSLSWKNSYWLIAFLAIFIGLLSIAGSIVLDWAVHHVVRQVYASDILEGAIAAATSGIILIRMQSRRRELLFRMQMMEDVNHHVRNALTSIALSSSLQQDENLDAQVKDACERVDWVLNHALVHTVSGKTPHPNPSKWRPGRRLSGKVGARR